MKKNPIQHLPFCFLYAISICFACFSFSACGGGGGGGGGSGIGSADSSASAVMDASAGTVVTKSSLSYTISSRSWSLSPAGNIVVQRTRTYSDGSTNIEAPYEFLKTSFVSLPDAVIAHGGTAGAFCGGGSTVINRFSIGKYEVTQELWTEVMGINPSHFSIDSLAPDEKQELRPAEMINFREAIYFCNKLSTILGREPCYSVSNWSGIDISAEAFAQAYKGSGSNKIGYGWKTISVDTAKNGFRLPSEAEWEYAARGTNASAPWAFRWAGTDSSASLLEYAWIGGSKGNAKLKTHETGLLKPNTCGLYDMCGNVWEWCWDSALADKNKRITRGGAFDKVEDSMKVTDSFAQSDSVQNPGGGFRIVHSGN